jgi:hypothetical protein
VSFVNALIAVHHVSSLDIEWNIRMRMLKILYKMMWHLMKNSNKSNQNSYENCNEIARNIERNIAMKLAEGCIKCHNEISRVLNKILQWN